MTVDDLEQLPPDGWQYELVEGVLVRMPPSGFEASTIALILGSALLSFVQTSGLGRVTGEQGGYILDPIHPHDTEVAPDVGFVQASRVPPRASPAYAKAFLGAPDLAVEVASPTQYHPAMDAKARLYLGAGTRLVWVIWPRYQQVDVWHPGATARTKTLGIDDTLDGEDVVPGFTLPVATLFS